MSGADIKISGNANQRFSGIIAAAEQVSISGSASFEGIILAADQSNSNTLVTQNYFSGVMHLRYDGGITFPPSAANSKNIAAVRSWRDREIARGTDVFDAESSINYQPGY